MATITQPTLSKFQHFEKFSLTIGAIIAALCALIAALGGFDLPLPNGWTLYVFDSAIASIGVILLLGFLAGWAQFLVRLKKYPRLLNILRWELAWFFSSFFAGLSLAVLFLPRPIELPMAPAPSPDSPFRYYLILSGMQGRTSYGAPDLDERIYNMDILLGLYDPSWRPEVIQPSRSFSCRGDSWRFGPFHLMRLWAANTDSKISAQYIQTHCTPVPQPAAHLVTNEKSETSNNYEQVNSSKINYDPILVTHPQHKTPVGHKTECVGRHLIDLPGAAEWATYKSRFEGDVYEYIASSLVGKSQEGFQLTYDTGTVAVALNQPVTTLGKLREGDRYGIQQYNKSMNDKVEIERQRRIARKKDEYQKTLPNLSQSSSEIEQIIAQEEAGAAMKAEQEEFYTSSEIDLNIPDSYFRHSPRRIWGYRWIDGRIYRFWFQLKKDETVETAKLRMKDLTGRIRPRPLYDIPEESGLCFPYGFIADDGKTAYGFTNSFHLNSIPGVTHTLRMGKNGAETLDPRIKLLDKKQQPWEVLVHDDTPQQTQHIELTPNFIGPYASQYAGFREHPEIDDKPSKHENYHIVSGIAGLYESDNVPFVYYQMNSYARRADPLAMENNNRQFVAPAPPHEQSLMVMNTILKSWRLRTPAAARTTMARQTAETFPVFIPMFNAISKELVIDCSKTTVSWRWRDKLSPRQWQTPLENIFGDNLIFSKGSTWYIVRDNTSPERIAFVLKDNIIALGTYNNDEGGAQISPEQERSIIKARCTGKDNFWLVDPKGVAAMPMMVKGIGR